jgi:hypothetical protein
MSPSTLRFIEAVMAQKTLQRRHRNGTSIGIHRAARIHCHLDVERNRFSPSAPLPSICSPTGLSVWLQSRHGHGNNEITACPAFRKSPNSNHNIQTLSSLIGASWFSRSIVRAWWTVWSPTLGIILDIWDLSPSICLRHLHRPLV